ncbi:MAG: LysM peptidoglycan-binding domain-containing protein [Chloroflexota bacterium]
MMARLVILGLVMLLVACCGNSEQVTPQASPVPPEKNASIDSQETPVPVPTEPAQRVHIVQAGENLWGIAQEYGVDVNVVLRANPEIKDASLIQPGQKIVIPGQ